ncbi:hypothetical protein ACFOY4_15630 [Actinomadura syzygii]|uniref:Uncharacterized protein n=1 Tax=Actinomadura syzygii TaxID=1427538 RepID=A0A5D0U1D3_9ACTN|nr:hypothetical protein [Actinomadura syzygii]TYC11603.1 hypothetical protein FXF65_26245 [Actinomadura syzygii]
MTGDLGSEAGRARSRPSFLPPVDGYPPPQAEAQAEPAPAAERPVRYGGAAWTLALIAAAAALVVSAFLPWAHASIVVELFGQPVGRDIGSVAGIDADDLVLAVPVLAVIAIALAFGDLLGRDPRIGGLAAIPGTLALLMCGVFVLRLGDVRDNLPQSGLDVGYQITVRYGWYTAVITSLLVVGFSLARPIGERVSKPRRRDAAEQYPQYDQDQQYDQGQQYYADPRYQADPYAVWPQEDQAWGRREEPNDHGEPEPRQTPDAPEEPKRDQS